MKRSTPFVAEPRATATVDRPQAGNREAGFSVCKFWIFRQENVQFHGMMFSVVTSLDADPIPPSRFSFRGHSSFFFSDRRTACLSFLSQNQSRREYLKPSSLPISANPNKECERPSHFGGVHSPFLPVPPELTQYLSDEQPMEPPQLALA